jgi:predicted small lipoprotein YifL
VLHTRATALRNVRNGSRASRNFFVAMCGAAMLAALAACGSDNPTQPPPPTVVGNYSLQSVDGKAPPDTIVNTGSDIVVFLDGTLSLHSDASYRLLFHTTETTSAGTVSDSSGSTGTYTVNGNTVAIHAASSSDSVIATVSLPTLTFTDGGKVFVFSK